MEKKWRIFRQSYTVKGEKRKSNTWSLVLWDHLGRKHQLNGFSTEKQAERYRDQIRKIVAYGGGEPSFELTRWVKNDLPEKWKSKLLEWGILNSNLFVEQVEEITPISDYLNRYKDQLKRGIRKRRKNTLDHVEATYNRVKRIIDDCGFKVWTDLDYNKVAEVLDSFEVTHKGVTQELNGLTYNYYCRDFESFVRFVIDCGFERVLPMGRKLVRSDAKYKPCRRALSPKEVTKLIKATVDAKKAFGMTGYERAIMYLTAVETGYRAGELSRLTVADFDLTTGSVNLDGSRTKNRNDAIQPIRKRRLLQYRLFFTGKQPTDKAFNFWKNPRTCEMIQKDLKRAKVKINQVVNGLALPADFHSTRVTYCTQLDQLDLTESEKDRLSRHSNKDSLRKSRYTQIDEERVREAIESLPDYGWPEPQKESVTIENESHDSQSKVG